MDKKQELFEEIGRHIIEDAKPSEFLNELCDGNELKKSPFDMLSCLKKTEQSPVYHPEGSVWNHTMLVVDEAAKRKDKSSDKNAFMWAALLHDIGKPGTTKIRNGKLTSYGHEKLGCEMAAEFFGEFTKDSGFIKKVSSLIRWHMQILHVVKSLPYADIKKMMEQVSVYDVALLGLCDRLGRLNADVKSEEETVKLFLEKCGVNLKNEHSNLF